MDFETWKTVSAKLGRLKPTDPHLRAVFPRTYAGCIVGHQGAICKKIQETHCVFLQIFSVPNARWGRVVSIKGTPYNQSRAWCDCTKRLLEGYRFHYEKTGFTMDFVLPDDLVDLFTLQDDFQRISSLTHTKILVKSACLPRSTERIVRVSTQDLSPKSVKMFEKFVFLLTELIATNLTIALCSPGNVFYIERAEDDIEQYVERIDHDNDLIFYPIAQNLRQHHTSPSTSSQTSPHQNYGYNQTQQNHDSYPSSENWKSSGEDDDEEEYELGYKEGLEFEEGYDDMDSFKSSSESVETSDSVKETSNTTQEVSNTVEKTSNNIEEASGSAEEINSNVEEVSNSAEEISSSVEKTSNIQEEDNNSPTIDQSDVALQDEKETQASSVESIKEDGEAHLENNETVKPKETDTDFVHNNCDSLPQKKDENLPKEREIDFPKDKKDDDGLPRLDNLQINNSSSSIYESDDERFHDASERVITRQNSSSSQAETED